jgi:capsular polysaccharide biosynthesis protein
MAYQNIDNLVHEKMVDENGYLTAPWQNALSQLFQKIQQSIGNAANEGLVPPTLTTAQLKIVQAGAQNGTLVYNSTIDQLVVKLNAEVTPPQVPPYYFHTIATTN